MGLGKRPGGKAEVRDELREPRAAGTALSAPLARVEPLLPQRFLHRTISSLFLLFFFCLFVNFCLLVFLTYSWSFRVLFVCNFFVWFGLCFLFACLVLFYLTSFH